MKILVATWQDNANETFLQEYFNDSIDYEDILKFYEDQKLIYGRTVIASYPNTRIFSDGSRVIMEIKTVKSKIEDEANSYVDVEFAPRQIGPYHEN